MNVTQNSSLGREPHTAYYVREWCRMWCYYIKQLPRCVYLVKRLLTHITQYLETSPDGGEISWFNFVCQYVSEIRKSGSIALRKNTTSWLTCVTNLAGHDWFRQIDLSYKGKVRYMIKSNYHPPKTLREGCVFSRACLFTEGSSSDDYLDLFKRGTPNPGPISSPPCFTIRGFSQP